jgi:hypothetical protein
MTDAVEMFLGNLKCTLQRFEPKPGDVFVLTFPFEVPLEQIQRIQSQWGETYPGNKCIVVGEGGRVEIQRPKD